TVERGNEVVGFNAHVQEPAQHIDHVVGVYGGEDQVARQRRVDGDLCRFLIADFADQNLVRIVTQDGTKTAGKCQPLLFVHGNLRYAPNLVFDRVFDGDDLVFVALDLVERGIERRGLAGTGRTGDQHHAVRLANITAEAAQILFGKTNYVEREVAKLLAHRLFVEHAEHGVFTMHGGHDGYAEVDQAALIAHAEAAVLRYASLGDVELAHDLDTAQNCGVVFAGDGSHRFLQHAVDAV